MKISRKDLKKLLEAYIGREGKPPIDAHSYQQQSLKNSPFGKKLDDLLNHDDPDFQRQGRIMHSTLAQDDILDAIYDAEEESGGDFIHNFGEDYKHPYHQIIDEVVYYGEQEIDSYYGDGLDHYAKLELERSGVKWDGSENDRKLFANYCLDWIFTDMAFDQLINQLYYELSNQQSYQLPIGGKPKPPEEIGGGIAQMFVTHPQHGYLELSPTISKRVNRTMHKLISTKKYDEVLEKVQNENK